MAINISNAQEMETLPTKFDCVSHFKTYINMSEVDTLNDIWRNFLFWWDTLYNLYERAKGESSAYISLSIAQPSFQFP